jgi:1,4-dihydroxy-2-naphthoyl-CoA hydrolase
MNEPTDAYVRRLVVRFHEIDRAGIAYFARVFEYCHVTYEDMLSEALGIDLEGFFQTSTWMMPLVHSEADYHAPMRLGDALRIELRVARLGRSSVTFAYEVLGQDDVRHASVRLVHACVVRDGFGSLAVPEPLVEGLKRLGLIPSEDDPAEV